MLNHKQILLEAKRIVNLVTSPPYLLPSLMISSGATNQENFSNNNLLSDLGDYLPFLYLFGAHKFCKDHVQQIANMTPGKRLSPTNSVLGMKVSYSYDYTDYLFGLLWYHEKSDNVTARKLIDETREIIAMQFRIGGNTCSLYMPKFNVSLPIFDTRDGMFLELSTNYLYKTISHTKLFDLYRQLISVPQFKKRGLWPNFYPYSWAKPLSLIPHFRQEFEKVTFIKNAANTLQGMLALYMSTGYKNILENINWCFESSLKYLLLDTGFFIHEGIFYKDKIINQVIHSGSNHTAIDLFCDLTFYLKNKKYLIPAIKIANAWLKIQGKTGLFPKSPTTKNDSLDSQTDMMVALMKLSEITGDKKFQLSAQKCLMGVYNHHRQPNGYVLEVNVDTGKVTNKNYKTKFIILFLKALYLFSVKDKIYLNPQLHEVIKDR